MTGYLVWFHTIQMAGILLASFYIFNKSIGHMATTAQKTFEALWSLLWAFLYGFMPAWMPLSLAVLGFCAVTIVLLWKVNGIKGEVSVSAYLLALGVSYSLYYAATLLSAVLFGLIMGPKYTDNYTFTTTSTLSNNPFYFLLYSLVLVLQLLFSWVLFRVRRFKNGFSFLFRRYALWITLVVTGALLELITLITSPGNVYYNYLYAAGILVVGAGTIIGIRRAIKATYRNRLREQTIELLEKQLEEKEAELAQLRAQNEIVRTANHKINRRLSAMERNVSAMAAQSVQPADGVPAETEGDFAGMLDEIHRLGAEYQQELGQLGEQKRLTSTKIKVIDDLFKFYQAQCAAAKIQFNLRVSGSILYLTEHVFPQNKLETMIGDHLQDALIAVNSGDNPFRGILAVLGLAGGCYELSVSDSGVEFEIDTLLRLGKEKVTTHEATGSSGIGFMTTFESVKQYGVSLIIEEKPPSPSDYGKSVTIRFDGKGEYIVKTYRPGQFPPTDGHPIVVGQDEDANRANPE